MAPPVAFYIYEHGEYNIWEFENKKSIFQHFSFVEQNWWAVEISCSVEFSMKKGLKLLGKKLLFKVCLFCFFLLYWIICNDGEVLLSNRRPIFKSTLIVKYIIFFLYQLLRKLLCPDEKHGN